MQFPLRLSLRPSRRLAWLLGTSHAVALASLASLDVPLWFKVIIGLAVGCSAVLGIRRHALLAAPDSTRGLLLGADGRIEFLRGESDSIAASVSGQTTVFPWLVVLLLDPVGKPGLAAVVIMADTLRVDEHRALRTWLRWKAVPN